MHAWRARAVKDDLKEYEMDDCAIEISDCRLQKKRHQKARRPQRGNSMMKIEFQRIKEAIKYDSPQETSTKGSPTFQLHYQPCLLCRVRTTMGEGGIGRPHTHHIGWGWHWKTTYAPHRVRVTLEDHIHTTSGEGGNGRPHTHHIRWGWHWKTTESTNPKGTNMRCTQGRPMLCAHKADLRCVADQLNASFPPLNTAFKITAKTTQVEMQKNVIHVVINFSSVGKKKVLKFWKASDAGKFIKVYMSTHVH